MIMDNLSICCYFSWYYYVLEPDDVITGNINVEPELKKKWTIKTTYVYV